MKKRGRLSIAPLAAAFLVAYTAGVAAFGRAEVPSLAFLIPSALVATLLGAIATGVVLILTLRTRWRASRIVLAGAYLSTALIAVLLLLVSHFADGTQIIITRPHFGTWIQQLWEIVIGAYALAYAALLLRIQRGATVPSRRAISAGVWTSVVVLPLLTIAAAWVLGTHATGTLATNGLGIAIALELFVATGAVARVKGDCIERAYAIALLAMSLGYLLDIYNRPTSIAGYAEMTLYPVWGLAVLVVAVSELLSAYEKLDRTEEALVGHTQRLAAMWEIAGDASLDEAQRFQAILDAGARAIRPGYSFRGHVARLDGEEIVVESVVSAAILPGDQEQDELLGVIAAGARLPIRDGLHADILAADATCDWADISLDPTAQRRERTRALGVRGVIGTTFRVGHEQYFLVYASRRPLTLPFDRDDRFFIELLGSFFAARLHGRRQLERIRREADLDALSNLPNREAFRTAAMQALREGGRSNEPLALAIIDLDRFNEINGTYGHAVGDCVIVAVAAGLRSRLLPGELAGRIGGDTFGVLLAGISDDATLSARLAALLGLFAEPLAEGSGGELVRVKANAGVAAFPQDARTYDDLIARSEAALQVAKRGDGGVARYHSELEAGLEVRRTMRRMLAGGIEANQLTVYYQPSITLSDGRPAGAEALVRWRHPTRGLVGPDDFIPFAEQHGLIGVIGTWVLQRVAADIAELGDRLGTGRIFINLSLNQVDDITLASQIASLLEQHPGLAQRIGFEITESAAMRDTGQTIRTLSAIRAFGIPFALDDFGTGYSSLSHLKRLPIDVIKIDRSFVAGIPGDEDDAALIETQFAIARQFGYETHAEGVEREDQLRWLRALGCRFAQGYLIARPMPFEDYVAWLTEREEASRSLPATEKIAHLATKASGPKTHVTSLRRRSG
jgi:diguanylate cyclase (GGDEF)-like protein